MLCCSYRVGFAPRINTAQNTQAPLEFSIFATIKHFLCASHNCPAMLVTIITIDSVVTAAVIVHKVLN